MDHDSEWHDLERSLNILDQLSDAQFEAFGVLRDRFMAFERQAHDRLASLKQLANSSSNSAPSCELRMSFHPVTPPDSAYLLLHLCNSDLIWAEAVLDMWQEAESDALVLALQPTDSEYSEEYAASLLHPGPSDRAASPRNNSSASSGSSGSSGSISASSGSASSGSTSASSGSSGSSGSISASSGSASSGSISASSGSVSSVSPFFRVTAAPVSWKSVNPNAPNLFDEVGDNGFPDDFDPSDRLLVLCELFPQTSSLSTDGVDGPRLVFRVLRTSVDASAPPEATPRRARAERRTDSPPSPGNVQCPTPCQNPEPGHCVKLEGVVEESRSGMSSWDHVLRSEFGLPVAPVEPVQPPVTVSVIDALRRALVTYGDDASAMLHDDARTLLQKQVYDLLSYHEIGRIKTRLLVKAVDLAVHAERMFLSSDTWPDPAGWHRFLDQYLSQELPSTQARPL